MYASGPTPSIRGVIVAVMALASAADLRLHHRVDPLLAVRRPRVLASVGTLDPNPGSEAGPRPQPGVRGLAGIADEVPSRMVSLWIDLVRQAGSGTVFDPPAVPGALSRQQLNALDLLRSGARTARSLALGLGVSPAAARAVIDHLVGVGMVVLLAGRPDDGTSILAATAEGVLIAEQDREAQLRALGRLLDQLVPARLLVMRRAMAELALGRPVSGRWPAGATDGGPAAKATDPVPDVLPSRRPFRPPGCALPLPSGRARQGSPSRGSWVPDCSLAAGGDRTVIYHGAFG